MLKHRDAHRAGTISVRITIMRAILASALTLMFAFLLSYSLFDTIPSHSINYEFISIQTIKHAATGCMPLFIMATGTNSANHKPNKGSVNKKVKKTSVVKLSVFKGREAKLNRAILLTLFQDSPLVVYDITKQVKKQKGFKSTKYTNVNRRVRALMQQGYIEIVGSRETQSGSLATLYQTTIRAKAAFYTKAVNPDQFIEQATAQTLTTALAAIVLFIEETHSEN